jgi:alkylhydroperoxidase family enzyme
VLLAKEFEAQGVEGLDAEALVESVIRDVDSSSLPEKEKALFRFVDKVNHRSTGISAADMQPLYAAGWDDAAIYYAITVCALFNFYNRWVDASGVPALSDKAHRQGGKRSASMGYVRK